MKLSFCCYFQFVFLFMLLCIIHFNRIIICVVFSMLQSVLCHCILCNWHYVTMTFSFINTMSSIGTRHTFYRQRGKQVLTDVRLRVRDRFDCFPFFGRTKKDICEKMAWVVENILLHVCTQCLGTCDLNFCSQISKRQKTNFFELFLLK